MELSFHLIARPSEGGKVPGCDAPGPGEDAESAG